MAAEVSLNFTSLLSFSNTSNDSGRVSVCAFQGIDSPSDLVYLVNESICHKHSVGFTIFLCLANLVILLFGLLGNAIVIYVVTWKLKKKTASSLFILNLAVADLLVILCCIPATLVANIFTPWIFGQPMCTLVAYAQGVSVFCSVYSLVAITFDRSRAIHQSMGICPNITTCQALKIILLIWAVGLTITLPWTTAFQLDYWHPDENNGNGIPFCNERWATKSQEITYFLLIHVFACFLLPLCFITICNIIIWRSVLGLCQNSLSMSQSTPCLSDIHKQRKLRVLKMFTFMTFVFFVFWMPLYAIIVRVKFFYNDDPFEQEWIAILVPIAQLLGSCNSCVNPVLYALLNQKFRESFKSIFVCSSLCRSMAPSSFSVVTRENSLAAVIVSRSRLVLRDTAL